MPNKRVHLVALTLLVILFSVIIVSSGFTMAWSLDMRLTWDEEYDAMPSVIQTTDEKIWVFWHSYRTNDAEIFYKVYDGSQVHPWSLEMRLTNNQSEDGTPSAMQAADGKMWVVWMSNRVGNYEIFYKIRDGISWSPDFRLTFDAAVDELPSIMQTEDGKIWVFWDSGRNGNYDIFYKTTLDSGQNWSPDSRLSISSTSADDWDPSVMQAKDNKIWLTWVRNDHVYYSVFDGSLWSSASKVTSGGLDNWHPSIMQTQDSKIWVVWDAGKVSATQPVPTDIYYSVFDGSWSSPLQITTDSAEDFMPSAIQDNGGTIWVVWTSDRSPFTDLYYRLNSTSPAHDVEIFSVIPSNPSVVLDESVSIEVVARNLGTNNETFEVQLYANSTLIGFQMVWDLFPGQLYPIDFIWDTMGFDLGKYIISANATIIAEETNTDNNFFTDGVVSVDWRDVAVTELTPFKTVVGQGFTLNVRTIVENQGTCTETFDLIVYYDVTPFGRQTLTLEPGNSATVSFAWNTASIAKGNYFLSAEATVVPFEKDTNDNFGTDGIVTVTIPGDVNGDRVVDLLDLNALCRAYGSAPGSSRWDSNCAINDDSIIDGVDLAIVGKNFGKTDL